MVGHLRLSLRKAGEGASLLQGVRVSRGHLKIQFVGTEEKPQHTANPATSGGVPGGVLGEIGVIDEWLPSMTRHQGRVASTRPDCCHGPPEVIKVLGVPAGDLSIGECGLSQRIHTSRVANVIQVVARDVPQGILPQHRTTIGPEVANLSLLRGACSTEERANWHYFVVVFRPYGTSS